ncbi:stabilizer of axonemal microtubules 5-like [Styela clava]
MEALHLIPAPLAGREFLASSHLRIGNDDRYIPEGWNSTVDTDYKPPSTKQKPDAALPPLPALFMHQDQEKINTQLSETREQFPRKKALTSTDTRDKYSALYKTNFKPNSDLRIKTFNTTHDYYYTAKPTSVPPDNTQLAVNWTKSSFPQGDKEKADEPISTYRTGFPGHDTSKMKIERVGSQHWGNQGTIKGDNVRRFGTTHTNTFHGLWSAPPDPVPKHFRSSVPEGDKEKVTEHSTTMRKSFTPHKTDWKSQNSGDSYAKLYATNYKQSDGKGTFDKYQSTAKESYPPISCESQRVHRSRDRNASDIPEGDTDANRGTERVNMTTTRRHHPPMNVRDARRVDGSKLRTKSNVLLGESTLAGKFYDTTCDSTYQTVNVPRFKANTYYPSVVPLSYYGNQREYPTTWSDFQNPRIGKMIPNPVALDNLRRTHISAPLGGQYFFSTTHDSHYTPKSIAKYKIDSGALQRTSVPIGTLGEFIPGCHNGWD